MAFSATLSAASEEACTAGCPWLCSVTCTTVLGSIFVLPTLVTASKRAMRLSRCSRRLRMSSSGEVTGYSSAVPVKAKLTRTSTLHAIA
jgi:hypothetical protein